MIGHVVLLSLIFESLIIYSASLCLNARVKARSLIKSLNLTLDRGHGEDERAPDGVGDDLDPEVSFPEVEKPPEDPGHQGGQDEHEVEGKDVDAGVDKGPHDKSLKIPPVFHQMFL